MPDTADPGSQSGQNWNPNLGEADAASVLTNLGQLEQLMPFLIGLTVRDRRRLAKVGVRTRPFVADAMATALANPGVVPRSVDLDRLRARLATLERLGEIKRVLASLSERVSDTHTQLGSELYAVGRSIYTVMKSPATVPGLQERKRLLGQRFARRRASQPSEEPASV